LGGKKGLSQVTNLVSSVALGDRAEPARDTDCVLSLPTDHILIKLPFKWQRLARRATAPRRARTARCTARRRL